MLPGGMVQEGLLLPPHHGSLVQAQQNHWAAGASLHSHLTVLAATLCLRLDVVVTLVIRGMGV